MRSAVLYIDIQITRPRRMPVQINRCSPTVSAAGKPVALLAHWPLACCSASTRSTALTNAAAGCAPDSAYRLPFPSALPTMKYGTPLIPSLRCFGGARVAAVGEWAERHCRHWQNMARRTNASKVRLHCPGSAPPALISLWPSPLPHSRLAASSLSSTACFPRFSCRYSCSCKTRMKTGPL